MMAALESLPDSAQEQLRTADPPTWTEPMLATLTDRRFSGDGWLFERKLDGERCLAFRNGTDGHLRSRNRKSLNAPYPELVEAIEGQSPTPFVLDGEVVAFSKGISSFSRLQQRMQIDDPEEARESRVAVYYYVFDLLHLDGYDLTNLALRNRKSVLKKAFSYDDPLRFTPHRNTEGEAFFEEACEKGWEGIIAKPLSPRPLDALAEVQVRTAAGVRDRGLHRSARRARWLRCTAAGGLRPQRPGVRGKGGHRLRRRDTPHTA
nr:hypothetical protein [Salinibacter sp. 10B]